MGEAEENARVGYQVATNLMMGQSQLYWSKFNALVVANSVIILAGATLLPAANDAEKKAPLILAGILGILLNVAAVYMLCRSHKFHNHWKEKAIGFEKFFNKQTESILIDTVTTSDDCIIKVCCLDLTVKGIARLLLLLLAVFYIVIIQRIW